MKNKNINILVVEDEIIASQYLQNILNNLGFTNLFEAVSFEEALKVVQNNLIDLIFMDINIDGKIDGINSAKTLNEEYIIPVIYTTAYGDSDTIQKACDSNLYAYLIKPFEPSDVESTLMVTLKKIDICQDLIDLGKTQRYNLQSHTLTINHKVISLTKKENDILHILCKNLNQNISYETLLEYVWQDQSVSNSTIRDTVSRLKKKAPNLNIETVINHGYILKLGD